MNAVVTIPMRTVSEANGREHWARKAKRVKAQRTASFLTTRQLLCPMPLEVTLTRVAPRALDDDNLRSALKAVRDGVADAFGIRDNDSRVVWLYAQRRGAAREYAVEIRARSTRNTLLPPVPELLSKHGAMVGGGGRVGVGGMLRELSGLEAGATLGEPAVAEDRVPREGRHVRVRSHRVRDAG